MTTYKTKAEASAKIASMELQGFHGVTFISDHYASALGVPCGGWYVMETIGGKII